MAVLKYKNPNWDGTTASEEYLTLTISGGGTSFDYAPSDNNKYVRSNGSWVFNYDTYTYDGDYKDSYYLGEPMKVTDDMEISNVKVGEGDVLITYKVTDIYGQEYWTPIVP